MSRTIVMTGASGFLGREVASILVQMGDTVIALSRDNCTLPPGVQGIAADLRYDFSPALLNVRRADAIVHLAQAGGWHNFPTGAGDIAAVALGATARLAEFATRVEATHFLFASSGGVYGPAPEPISEAAPFRPAADLGFYLATKASGEALLSYFRDRLALQILRFFFIYGPGQGPDFLFPRLLRSISEGRPITVAGGRGSRINPVFITDAAWAVIEALGQPRSLVANTAGPEIVTIYDIASGMGRLLGKEPIFDITDKLPDDYVADITRMCELLRPPKIGIQHGLATLTCSNKGT